MPARDIVRCFLNLSAAGAIVLIGATLALSASGVEEWLAWTLALAVVLGGLLLIYGLVEVADWC